MLKPEFAEYQIRRLTGLGLFPADEVAVVELVDWLIKCAPGEAAAVEFIDIWLRTNPEAPKPCDIYEHFNPLPCNKEFGAATEIRCQICGDTGFKIIERPGGITAATKCECQAVPR
ncbi:MAG TPA: hypothetical protein VGG62_12115 [Terracidiphilus sp.]|jgi:hypothetical protein